MIQIEGKRLLTPLEQRYLITNEELNQYELVMNSDLLKYNNLKQAFRRFHTLSQCFGPNTRPFQLAAAFVLARILRNASSPGDVWTESSLGMIFSKTKCIGKSLSLYLLALAQGIPSRVHLMFLSGGNQNVCGTSAKKMQESLSSTNFVVFIDDPDINKSFGEFLLQVQGGLLSGSKKEGMSASRAGVLLSSNSPEISRIVGRVVRFNYTGPREDIPEHDSWILENSMIPHLQENKGLFLAWAILYIDVWKRIYSEASVIIKTILERVFADAQPQQRWLKGVSSLVLANAMIRLSIDRPANTSHVIAYLIHDTLVEETPQDSELSPIQKLERSILQAIKCDGKNVLTWLHPGIRVADKAGKKVPGVAIKTTTIEGFASVSHTEMKQLYQGMVESPTTIGCYFNKSKEATLSDLSRREGTVQHRAYRIPFSQLSQYTENYIKYASGMIKEKPQEDSPIQEELNIPALTPEEEATLETLEMNLKKAIDECERQSGITPSKRPLVDNSGVSQELTPKTRQRYMSLTPRKRKAFDMGLEAGKRIQAEKDYVDTADLIVDSSETPAAAVGGKPASSKSADCEEVGPSGSIAERPAAASSESVARQLFADGTFGVVSRQVASDKKTRSKYCTCKVKKSEEEENEMLLCETKKKPQVLQ